MIDMTLLLYVFGSVLVVSLVSLIGLASLAVDQKRLEKILLYLVSFAVGALFGDVFIHLLPEAFKQSTTAYIGIYVLCGILFSFIRDGSAVARRWSGPRHPFARAHRLRHDCLHSG